MSYCDASTSLRWEGFCVAILTSDVWYPGIHSKACKGPKFRRPTFKTSSFLRQDTETVPSGLSFGFTVPGWTLRARSRSEHVHESQQEATRPQNSVTTGSPCRLQTVFVWGPPNAALNPKSSGTCPKRPIPLN